MALVQRKMVVGWVAISDALGVVERTARRWADRTNDPLPVRNLNTAQVAAWSDEIRAWRVRNEEQAGGRKRKSRPSFHREAA